MIYRMLTYSDARHEDETFRKTPLKWAIENQDIELLKRLIDHKVKHVEEPTQATFHLNATVERDVDEARRWQAYNP